MKRETGSRNIYRTGILAAGLLFAVVFSAANPRILDRKIKGWNIYALLETEVSMQGETTVRLYKYWFFDSQETAAEFYRTNVGDCKELTDDEFGIYFRKHCR